MLIMVLVIGVTMGLGVVITLWLLKKASEVSTGISPVMKKFKTWEYDDEPDKYNQ